MGERFDREYYDKFYHDRATRVVSPHSVRRLGRFISSYLKYLQLPVESVLDIGCGLGYWQTVIEEHFPKATYTGVEFSQYLCEQYGWQQGSVVDYASEASFDFVICQGVLQYLGRRDAQRAIKNLRQLCHGGLYLEALTKKDWAEVCDQSSTDGSVHLRSGEWYRKQLAPHFYSCGGGLFLAHEAPVLLFELEQCNAIDP